MTAPAETRKYHVDGMTCDHCALSVKEEVGDVAGVATVDVELDSGTLTVSGATLRDDAIKAAVEEAGYVLSS
jgi:copper chaperone CopZ